MDEAKDRLDRLEHKIDELLKLTKDTLVDARAELVSVREELSTAQARNAELEESLAKMVAKVSSDSLEMIIGKCSSSKHVLPEMVEIEREVEIARIVSAETKIYKPDLEAMLNPAPNVSIYIDYSPVLITLIPGLEASQNQFFQQALAVFADGVASYADLMDKDVETFLSPDRTQLVFQRTKPESTQALRDGYTSRGWEACGCQVVRVYSSLAEWQASPG